MPAPRAPSAPLAPAGRSTARPGVGLPPSAPAGEAAALRVAADKLKAMAKTFRPHELVAMLASHYARARISHRPRVATTLQVFRTDGQSAVRLQV